MKILFAVSFLLLTACTSLMGSKDMSLLPAKGQILEFKIIAANKYVTPEENIRINLIFRTFSNDEIGIEEPNCYGRNIIAFLYDTKGNRLQQQVKIKVFCDPKFRKIMKNKIFETKFPYHLDHLYDFKVAGIYEVRFAYMGAILNADDEIIANDCPIYSNTIKIEVLK